MPTLKLNAYAKINAYLEVTGRREDGYHTILSHMQAVTLHDVLALTYERAADEPFSVTLTTSDPSLTCDGTNLVCRAADAFVETARSRGVCIKGNLTVQLQKNIPVAAGLAGGSADAAATLRGMNELLGKPLTTQELCDIGARLGADIPFCIRAVQCSAMTARGIGELLCPAPTLPSKAYLVIACHGEGVSTPWAYRRLDELGVPDEQETERQYTAYLSALETGDLAALAACTHNCFERVVMSERVAVPMLMSEMVRHGAVVARMSGSGPSVVGFFDEQAAAEQCNRALSQKGIRAHVCRPL